MEQNMEGTIQELSEEMLQEVAGGMGPQERIQAAQARIQVAKQALLVEHMVRAPDRVPGGAVAVDTLAHGVEFVDSAILDQLPALPLSEGLEGDEMVPSSNQHREE